MGLCWFWAFTGFTGFANRSFPLRGTNALPIPNAC